MSDTKFTPGPWSFSRWEQWGNTRFYVAQADDAPYTPNYSYVATLIAETVSGERVAVQEANARLIAAAPELFEALTYARRFLKADDHDTEYVDSILAKATGEQT